MSPPTHTPIPTPEEIAKSLVDIGYRQGIDAWLESIIEAVTPLYQRLQESEQLLAIVCYDHADFIELGRQEERGRIITALVSAREAVMKPHAYPPSVDEMGLWVAIDLVQKRGPSLPNPLPPTVAAGRIAQLERALINILRKTPYSDVGIIGDIRKEALSVLHIDEKGQHTPV